MKLAAVLLPAVLVAWPGLATAIPLESTLFADLSVAGVISGGGAPPVEVLDEATRLVGGFGEVEALAQRGPLGSAALQRASATGDAAGIFEVGVRSFFGPAPDPLVVMLAKGSFAQDVLNDSGETQSFGTAVTIPAPVIEFRGFFSAIGPGVDPLTLPLAEVSALVRASVTRLDGSREDAVLLDYGMRVQGFAGSSGFVPFLSRDAPEATELEDSRGLFRYTLPALDIAFPSFATLAPGESLSLSFEYFARAQNGTEETQVFAGIGDPFDLDRGTGRFGFGTATVVAPPPPSAVPLPAALPLLAAALGGLGLLTRRRRA